MPPEGINGSLCVDAFERKPAAIATLYLVPHAGAGVALVRHLNRRISPLVDVRGICLPLREKRISEDFDGTLDELAAGVASAIICDAAGRPSPFLLGGVCSGAWIAYATAAHLSSSTSSSRFSGFLAAARGYGPGAGADAFDPVLLGGFDAEIVSNAEMMELLVERCRLDCRLAAQPVEAPLLNVPIRVVAGEQDLLIDDQALAGWAQLTRASCRIERIAAGHHLLQEPDDRAFGTTIENWVRELVSYPSQSHPTPASEAAQEPYIRTDAEKENPTLQRSGWRQVTGTSLRYMPALVIQSAWEETLGLASADPEIGFFDAGGDSMLAVRLVGRCRRAGVALGISELLEAGSLAELLASASGAERQPPAAPMGTAQTRNLLPAECRWMEESFADPDHFNVGDVYAVGPEITDLQIAQAVLRIAGRHEALRTRYPSTRSGPAWIGPVDPQAIIAPPKRDIDPDDVEAVKAVVRALQTDFSLSKGRLFRVCRLGPLGKPGLLVVVVHHIAIDGFGYALLVDELDAALAGDCEEGVPPVGPSELMATLERFFADPRTASEEAKRWAAFTPRPEISPSGLTPERVLGSTARTVRSRLSMKAVSAGARGTALESFSIEDRLLLSVLVESARWTGQSEAAVDLYHHARDVTPEQIPLTQTVAYLQATHPFSLSFSETDTLDDLVERFRAKRVAVPALRMGYDFLRFSAEECTRKVLSHHRKPEIGFNFRANYRRFAHAPRRHLHSRSDLFVGARSPRQHQKYALLIEGDITPEELIVDITFASGSLVETKVQDLNEAICAFLVTPSLNASSTCGGTGRALDKGVRRW
jgi:surfactin synthase thioesterase subunit/aryl carrier-like protein